MRIVTASTPYVIRHTRRVDKGSIGKLPVEPVVLSVKAVEGLAAAHDFIGEIINGRPELTAGMTPMDLMHIGERGGAVTLADGSVVSVEATTWTRLASEAEVARTAAQRTYVRHTRLSASERRGILNDWNARFGVSSQSEGVR